MCALSLSDTPRARRVAETRSPLAGRRPDSPPASDGEPGAARTAVRGRPDRPASPRPDRAPATSDPVGGRDHALSHSNPPRSPARPPPDQAPAPTRPNARPPTRPSVRPPTRPSVRPPTRPSVRTPSPSHSNSPQPAAAPLSRPSARPPARPGAHPHGRLRPAPGYWGPTGARGPVRAAASGAHSGSADSPSRARLLAPRPLEPSTARLPDPSAPDPSAPDPSASRPLGLRVGREVRRATGWPGRRPHGRLRPRTVPPSDPYRAAVRPVPCRRQALPGGSPGPSGRDVGAPNRPRLPCRPPCRLRNPCGGPVARARYASPRTPLIT